MTRSTGVVLVVDDEPSIQLFLKRAVTRCGYEVLIATGMSDATALLRSHPVDCALIDKNLSDGNGLELLRVGRELQPTMDVIIITGFANSQSAIEALRLGAIDYVAKPFDFHTIAHRLKAAFERRRARTEQARLEGMLAHAERLASLGTMAAGLVHELNNPLCYLAANLQCVEDDVAAARAKGQPLSLDGIVSALHDMHTGIERLTDIVRDLRIFSRRDDASIASVSLETCLDTAVKVATAGRPNMPRVERRYGPAPMVRGSRTRFEQVFVNLIANAAHAIAKANKATGTITLTTREVQGAAVVEIGDDGAGMTPEVRARLFEPFFTTKPEGEGTGLGLSVCHGIVTQAGGTIEVHSEPGSGTTFTLKFPAAPGPTSPPARAP